MEGKTNFLINLFYNGKYYAFVRQFNNSDNLAKVGFNFGVCASFNVVKSYKRAVEIAEEWNKTHAQYGELMEWEELNEALFYFYGKKAEV